MNKTNLTHVVLEVVQVVNRKQVASERLLACEMMQHRPRVAPFAAHIAWALVADDAVVVGVGALIKLEETRRHDGSSEASSPAGPHAIEHVDSHCDTD